MIVDLNLRGKHAVVIGGGTEGVRKVKGLLGQECRVTVISNRVNSYLVRQASAGKIELVKASLRDASILDQYKDVFLVLAATNDKELNRKIVEKGRSIGAFVYAADDPPVSDFSYASASNAELAWPSFIEGSPNRITALMPSPAISSTSRIKFPIGSLRISGIDAIV